MTRKKNFETIVKTVEAQIASGNSRMTIAAQNEFGGVYFLHVTMTSAEIRPYAQYPESLLLLFKKRGGRTTYGMRIYGEKPIAIFSGWAETTYEQPKSFWCFDKNLFYGLVDGFPQEAKLAEESERIHLVQIAQKGKIYKVVRLAPTKQSPWAMTSQIFYSASELTESYEQSGEFRSVSCRAELQGAPRLKGFCGPMYDGEDAEGNSVLRYESAEVNEILSA